MSQLEKLLLRYQNQFATIIPHHLQHGRAVVLDLNSELSPFYTIAPQDTKQLTNITQQLIQENNADIAIGQYAENRFIYRDNPLFISKEKTRQIHLGIDLTVPAGTPVLAPLNSTIHSFKDNSTRGDYGPTIILQHQLENTIFYTLYGHLSRESLSPLTIGQAIAKGELFAHVGTTMENGSWPIHLHFQIIHDLQNHFGDYPGSIAEDEKEFYLQNCPNPNLILNISL